MLPQKSLNEGEVTEGEVLEDALLEDEVDELINRENY